MASAIFGPGIAIVTRTDVTGSTPINIGYAQELELSWKGETKELYGTDQFALVVARGTIKATGKLKAAMFSGLAWNSTFFGMSTPLPTGGSLSWNINESHAIPADGHVTATQSAQFDTDLGAVYDSNRFPFQKNQGSSPAAGFYSVSAGGVYLFATAESGKTADLNYTSTTTLGQSLNVTNQLIGTTPNFQLDYYTNLNQPTAQPWAVRLFACVASDISIAPKLSDFAMPAFDFAFYALQNGKVFNILEANVD